MQNLEVCKIKNEVRITLFLSYANMIMENFPFTPGEFYEHDDIWPKLKIGNRGGIRPSNENKIVVIFWNARDEQRNDTSDSLSNIYNDRYEQESGLIYYTGEGQEGDQTLGGNNGRIANAKQNGDEIHLFRQYQARHPRQYMGEVELVDYSVERQPDKNGNERNVYLFILKPLADRNVIYEKLIEFIAQLKLNEES